MTFEEEFPSLKEKVVQRTIIEKDTCHFPYSVDMENIQEHCLDKQRVKETIIKYTKKHCECSNEWECGCCRLQVDLFKELEL